MSTESDPSAGPISNFGGRDFDHAATALPPGDIPEEDFDEELYAKQHTPALGGEIDLKATVLRLDAQLKSVHRKLFNAKNEPKVETEVRDIASYMRIYMSLLTVMQKFTDAFATDDDFRRIEHALERTFEELDCPEFLEAYKRNLEEDQET